MQAATTYPAIIGRIIAERRKKLGMDQATAADEAGINRSSWSRIENGETTPDAVQLSKIATALGLSSDGIIARANEAKKTLEKQGIDVRLDPPAKSKSSTGIIALLGAAALGGLVYAATKKDSEDTPAKPSSGNPAGAGRSNKPKK